MVSALLSLLNRLTKARADKLDNLDGTISSRATDAGTTTAVWAAGSNRGTKLDNISTTVSTNLNATVSSRSTLTDAQVWSYATREITSIPSVIKSVQRGSVNFTSSTYSGNITISSVNLDTSMLLTSVKSGYKSQGGTYGGYNAIIAGAYLSSADKITWSSLEPSTSGTLYWQVIEFN